MTSGGNNDEFTRQLKAIFSCMDSLCLRARESTFDQKDLLADSLDQLRAMLEGLRMFDERLRHQNNEPIAAHTALDVESNKYEYPFEFAPDARPVIDRERSQEKLRKSESLFRAIFESALDAMLIADDDANYVDANAAACTLFGVPKEEILKRKIEDFAEPGHSLEARKSWRAFLQEGDQEGEFTLYRPDGTTRQLEFRAKANVLSGRHLSILHDITRRKRVEEDLTARARQQTVVSELGQRALSGADLPTLMNLAAKLVAQALEAEYCEILELLPDGDALLLRAGAGWTENVVGKATVSSRKDSQAGYTLLSSAPVIVEDLRAETRFAGMPLLQEHGVTSGMSVIINGQGRPFGVLGAHTTRRRAFTRNDINFLQSVASILAEAIRNKCTEEGLRRTREELAIRVEERTVQLSNTNILLRAEIAERKRTEEALSRSEARFRTVIQGAAMGIALVNKDGRAIETNPALQEMLGYTEEEFRGKSFTEIAHSGDVQAAANFYRELITGKRGYYQTEVRFSRKGGQIIWTRLTVSLMRAEDGKPHFAICLVEDISDRKKAAEALRLQNEYLSALHETTLGLINRLDVKNLLEALIMRACALVGAPDGFIYLVNPDESAMEVRMGTGVAHQFIGFRIKPGEGLSGKIWQTGQPLVVNDYRNWPGRLQDSRYDIFRATVGVPLKSGDRVIGVLALEYTEQRREFGERDVEILSRFAELGSIALDNAQLFAAAQQELTERLRAEEEIKKRNRELASLNTAIATISRSIELPEVLATLKWLFAEHLAIPGGGIFLCDKDEDGLRLRSAWGLTPEVLSEFEKFPYHRPEWQSYLQIPLLAKGEIEGIAILLSESPNLFDADQSTFFEILADEAGSAIQNARQFEEVRVARERLQALSQQLVKAQETERRRIANELHDEIGQLLTALIFSLELCKRVTIDKAKDHLDKAQAIANDLITQVRSLSLSLRPAMLDDFGLLSALLWLFERYTALTDIRVNFEHTGLEKRFQPEIEITIYRIVQESLTNVARHAKVSEARVRVWANEDTLCAQIEDQGGGFDTKAESGKYVSSGLAGMRERAFSLRGQLSFESAPGDGTRLTVQLPLGKPIEEERAAGEQGDYNID